MKIAKPIPETVAAIPDPKISYVVYQNMAKPLFHQVVIDSHDKTYKMLDVFNNEICTQQSEDMASLHQIYTKDNRWKCHVIGDAEDYFKFLARWAGA